MSLLDLEPDAPPLANVTASPVDLLSNDNATNTNTDAPPSRRSFQSHSRTMSAAIDYGSRARQNRFSVHFPMQAPVIPEVEHGETSTAALERPMSAAGVAGTSFLTSLAAQERRVLELKEELQRAESELDKLKRQWAKHEAEKKVQVERHLTKELQPLQTTTTLLGDEVELDPIALQKQKEMDRRKALMQLNRPSNRTVFSGSRHTRTLSLLSPTGDAPGLGAPQQLATRPPRRESLFEPKKSVAYKASRDSQPHRHNASTADLGLNILDAPIDHELLIRTGKKFATDFKDGLMTFWEDIRQATVGEEATQPLPPTSPKRKGSVQTLRAPRKQSSRNSLRSSSSRGSSVARKPSYDSGRAAAASFKASNASLPDLSDSTFWSDGILVGAQTMAVTSQQSQQQQQPKSPPVTAAVPASPEHLRSPNRPNSVPEEDPWDTWDDNNSSSASPQQSRHSSYATSETNTAPSTVFSMSPRTSTSTNADATEQQQQSASSAGNGKTEGVPWSAAALGKLGPSALKRTASTLMREWERSLTPSPGKETGVMDFLGGTEAPMKRD